MELTPTIVAGIKLPVTVEYEIAEWDERYCYIADADGNELMGLGDNAGNRAIADEAARNINAFPAAVEMYQAVHALLHEMQVRADNDIYLGQMFRRVVPGPLWDETRTTMQAFYDTTQNKTGDTHD